MDITQFVYSSVVGLSSESHVENPAFLCLSFVFRRVVFLEVALRQVLGKYQTLPKCQSTFNMAGSGVRIGKTAP